MKLALLLVGFIALFPNSFWAQEVVVNDEAVQFSSGSHDAIVVSIPFAKREVVEKQLKSEMKSWGGKLIISGDEYKVIQGKMRIFGENRIDGYAKIIETAEDIRVAFVIDMGGRYMTSGEDPIEYKTVRERVKNFGAKTATAGIGADVDSDKKVLKSLEKEERKIEKSIESSNKDIENYQKKIKQAEKDIETKKAELSAKQEEIKTQNLQINERKKTAKKIK
ncbi:MAG: coiled-coil domain-containing protein [Fluviicola sp.]